MIPKLSLDLNAIISEVTSKIVDLAKQEAEGYIEQASRDAVDFVKLVFDNMNRWAKLVISEELTMSEFKFLLKGQKGLLVMHSLSLAGLAAVRIQRIRDGIINILVSTVTGMITAI